MMTADDGTEHDRASDSTTATSATNGIAVTPLEGQANGLKYRRRLQQQQSSSSKPVDAPNPQDVDAAAAAAAAVVVVGNRQGHPNKEHSSFREDGSEGGEDSRSADGLVGFHRDGLMKEDGADPFEGRTEEGDGASDDSTGAGSDFWQTLAGVVGNVLEWYDFAVFGYFDDVLGRVFFPPQQGDAAITESFAVFGGAFLMRPIGGLVLGYIGDVYGRKKALVYSIFLMAFPTFLMGCLPGYQQAGDVAIILLVVVRLLQGLSVGGQLMSSLVFTLENHPPSRWGLYGSFVMAAANFGTLLGGIVATALRASLTESQLQSWGWRIPFLSGIIVSLSGFYLRSSHEDGADPTVAHGGASAATSLSGHQMVPTDPDAAAGVDPVPHEEGGDGDGDECGREGGGEIAAPSPHAPPNNPIYQVFARKNLRSLAASAMVPMLWSGGFYLSFVWMAIYMTDLIDAPVPHAFAVNSAALLFSVCLFFPLAGMLSDRYGRRSVMTAGGLGLAVLSPVLVWVIGQRGGRSALWAFMAQSVQGVLVSLWGAPMLAWLVESFEPSHRLTSVAVGYNAAQALVGGATPAVATALVEHAGREAPGWILTALSVVALSGLWLVAPTRPAASTSAAPAVRTRTASAPNRSTPGAAYIAAVAQKGTAKDRTAFAAVPIDSRAAAELEMVTAAEEIREIA